MARSPRSRSRSISSWLDVLAIASWGVLFLRYAATDKLYLLIHPNYFGLTIAAAVVLLLVAAWRTVVLLRRSRQIAAEPHTTLLPPGVSSLLLIAIAVLGLVVSPRAFASQTAIDRGVGDTLSATRVKPQAFRGNASSEERSLIEWIRVLTVYPEPDAYVGQRAKVQGFVTHPPNLGPEYLLISRFIITCCAADAYPISLPVKLTQSRDAYKPDSWLEIEGQMITETLVGKRQLTIEAKSLKPIPEPKNPYDY
ncbi:MAG TPA: TIGR03943 family protein [Thermosynechococcaceae cyanobacterium]